MTSIWRRIALEQAGPDYARAYARRFRELAERGTDVHGEAALVGSLRAAPARVLDAGCGTGRVAARLAQLGYAVTGCDVDEPMVDQARAQWPDLAWHVADLAGLGTTDAPRDLRGPFDVVVVAGNVLPMVEPGTLDDVSRGLGAVLAESGVVVTGFGLDAAHLPAGCPVLALDDAEASWRRAGLRVRSRLSGWDGAPYDGGGYVVAVLEAAHG